MRLQQKKVYCGTFYWHRFPELWRISQDHFKHFILASSFLMILLKKQPSVDWEEQQVLCAGHQETSGRRWLQEHIWHIRTVWSIQIKEKCPKLSIIMSTEIPINTVLSPSPIQHKRFVLQCGAKWNLAHIQVFFVGLKSVNHHWTPK